MKFIECHQAHVTHNGDTFSEVGNNAYAATRRAIVRAAAEIGSAL